MCGCVDRTEFINKKTIDRIIKKIYFLFIVLKFFLLKYFLLKIINNKENIFKKNVPKI